jgi:hypothetical protein
LMTGSARTSNLTILQSFWREPVKSLSLAVFLPKILTASLTCFLLNRPGGSNLPTVLPEDAPL